MASDPDHRQVLPTMGRTVGREVSDSPIGIHGMIVVYLPTFTVNLSQMGSMYGMFTIVYLHLVDVYLRLVDFYGKCTVGKYSLHGWYGIGLFCLNSI